MEENLMIEKLAKLKEVKEVMDPMKHCLETDRLNLIPLQAHSLALSLVDYGKMQTDLGLRVTKTILEDNEMQYAMSVRLRKVLEDVDHYLWLTNWAIVLKEKSEIIGYIMLKGLPNESGEVITGYDIDEEFRRKGFATEALNRLIQWIFENPRALSVIADTEKTNIPSCKLLEHVGAVLYKETDELLWWKIDKNKWQK
jgi:RimJ/RimL family protein N-acetyltransferase